MPILNNSLLTTLKRCLPYIILTYIFTISYIILSYIFTCILRTGIFQKLFFRLLCQCDFQSPITDQHHIRTVSNMYGGDFFVEIVHWFYCKLFSQKSSIKDVWKGPIIGSTQNLLSQMISIPNIIKHKHTKRSLIQEIKLYDLQKYLLLTFRKVILQWEWEWEWQWESSFQNIHTVI